MRLALAHQRQVRATKHQHWLTVYDCTTDRCFYVPASELGEFGRSRIHLRLEPARSGRLQGIRMADDYVHPTAR